MASEVADHAADHDPEAARARASRQRQRLGQAAGLVELDVDGVVAAGERGEVGAVVQRFVGADRERARQPASAASAPAGSGCSISSTPVSAQRRHERGQSVRASRPRWRRR